MSARETMGAPGWQGPWTLISGTIDAEQIESACARAAAQHDLRLERADEARLQLLAQDGALAVLVRWRAGGAGRVGVLGSAGSDEHGLDVLISCEAPRFEPVAAKLAELLDAHARPYSHAELSSVLASMPLLDGCSDAGGVFERWAMIFRDHYLEHSVGFVLAVERCGIPPEWIFTLAKGDRTRNRDRVHATFLARGYRSDVFDNADIDGPGGPRPERTARVQARIDRFIDAAHAAGRRVLVVDDGGLLARGYGCAHPRRVDAAIELTVSGLKRIAAAGPLAIPIINMARSAVKTHLGYAEIADSCLRRLREILPTQKLIGRPVLVLGYGTLGSRLAGALRALGCQVTVVDPDTLTLIGAAESGYATHLTVREALLATRPFLVAGTTGELALGAEDLALLPDGVHLAPFATRDFSLLTDPASAPPSVELPHVGRRFLLAGARRVVLLGDGRSLNLFEADSIPNQGYDAYRAGTLLVARALCASEPLPPPGLQTAFGDEVIDGAGLFEAYYHRYLAARPDAAPIPSAVPRPGAVPSASSPVAPPVLPLSPRIASARDAAAVDFALGGAAAAPGPAASDYAGLRACVVGYGVAGRLHHELLSELGARVRVLDPKLTDDPEREWFNFDGRNPPASLAREVDVWSICCPTEHHLEVLHAVFGHNPAARVLLEKPACNGHEIGRLEELLARHPAARVVVNDHYRNASALPALLALAAELEPGRQPEEITVAFTKDRTEDIARGRFVDRAYGVLGYEWLHMLAVLRELLPGDAVDEYLRSDPRLSGLWVTYHPELFVSALTERATLPLAEGRRVRLALSSSIVGTSVALGAEPRAPERWRRRIRASDDRSRQIAVDVGGTHFTLHLDPVTAGGGWQLERNHHRLTAERGGRLVHDEVIADSPLRTGVRNGVALLLDTAPPPPPDLLPLRRIAALARILRERGPDEALSDSGDVMLAQV